MDRKTTLEEAIKIVCSDRNKQYGEPEDNFSKIADLWEAYLVGKCVAPGADVSIIAEDVAIMMCLFKIGRMATAIDQKADSFVDLAGYAACACEIATER